MPALTSPIAGGTASPPAPVSITPLQARVLEGLCRDMPIGRIAENLSVHRSYVTATRGRLIRIFRVKTVAELLAAAASCAPTVKEATQRPGVTKAEGSRYRFPAENRQQRAVRDATRPIREVTIDATKTCLWPLGKCRCDAPVILGKPYCHEHCKLAYVALRER